MTKQIDHDYFEWLISQIEVRSSRTFNGLFERMHNIEFVWTVPNDDNRLQDGLDLRAQFLNGARRTINLDGATILEVLIGLSRRVAFTAGGEAPWWAWQLIENLRLHKQADPLTNQKADVIDEKLQDLIWRTYQRDGQGGFFPLNSALEDQTKIEIWYQMNAYVMEIQEL